jgi:hypothetical protein
MALVWGVAAACVAQDTGAGSDNPWLEPSAPRQERLWDPRADPILNIRTSVIYTLSEQRTVTTGIGESLRLDSSTMDPSPFGHRQGFVLENAETGIEGRFNDEGLYYRLMFELIPREKDGNRSNDIMREAYVGWNRYRVFDVRAGSMLIPFSQVNLKQSFQQRTTYFPAFNVLIPKRQIGLQASLADPYGILRLTAGAFNSANSPVEQLDDWDEVMLVTRAELSVHDIVKTATRRTADFQLRLAGSVAWSDTYYDPRTEHRWWGVDLFAQLWRFELEAELLVKDYYTGEVLVGGRERAFRGLGWHVDLAARVIEGWLSVGIRYEQMDGETELERGFDTSFTTDDLSRQKKLWVTAFVTTYLHRRARLNIEYIHRRELEGFSLDNDVLLSNLQLSL